MIIFLRVRLQAATRSVALAHLHCESPELGPLATLLGSEIAAATNGSVVPKRLMPATAAASVGAGIGVSAMGIQGHL